MLADCRDAPGHRRDFARALNIIIKRHEVVDTVVDTVDNLFNVMQL